MTIKKIEEIELEMVKTSGMTKESHASAMQKLLSKQVEEKKEWEQLRESIR